MTNTRHSGPHLSPLQLDAALLGSPGEAAAMEHLRTCSTCAALRAEVERGVQHFQERVFARTVPRMQSELGRRPGWLAGWRIFPVLALPALAAGVLALVNLRTLSPAPETDAPAYAIKGEVAASWKVYARRNGAVFAVSEGARLLPGDQLRFQVRAGGAKYLIVGSVDGAGRASVYVPFEGNASIALGGAGETFDLPGSVILDEALGLERLFAVFSATPIERFEMRAALEAYAALPEEQRGAETRLKLTAPDVRQLSLAFSKDKEVAP